MCNCIGFVFYPLWIIETPILFDIGAAVVSNALNLQTEFGLGRNFERFSCPYRFPPVCSGQQNFQLTGEKFHKLLVRSAEFVFPGKHDPKRFPRTVREEDSTTGDFTVKVDIGLLDYRYILEFCHEELLYAINDL